MKRKSNSTIRWFSIFNYFLRFDFEEAKNAKFQIKVHQQFDFPFPLTFTPFLLKKNWNISDADYYNTVKLTWKWWSDEAQKIEIVGFLFITGDRNMVLHGYWLPTMGFDKPPGTCCLVYFIPRFKSTIWTWNDANNSNSLIFMHDA